MLRVYSLDGAIELITALDAGKCAQEWQPGSSVMCTLPAGHEGLHCRGEAVDTVAESEANLLNKIPEVEGKYIFEYAFGLETVSRGDAVTLAKKSLEKPQDKLYSFDAQVWAREFNKVLRNMRCSGDGINCDFDRDGLPIHVQLDEGWLTGWFANALMRGYDEKQWQVDEEVVGVAQRLLSETVSGEKPQDKMSAREAVMGFAAWLTTRDEAVTLGSAHPCGDVSRLVDEFCDANALAPIRESWPDGLKMPQSQQEVGAEHKEETKHRVIRGEPRK
jgi:hypothetical protein